MPTSGGCPDVGINYRHAVPRAVRYAPGERFAVRTRASAPRQRAAGGHHRDREHANRHDRSAGRGDELVLVLAGVLVGILVGVRLLAVARSRRTRLVAVPDSGRDPGLGSGFGVGSGSGSGSGFGSGSGSAFSATVTVTEAVTDGTATDATVTRLYRPSAPSPCRPRRR